MIHHTLMLDFDHLHEITLQDHQVALVIHHRFQLFHRLNLTQGNLNIEHAILSATQIAAPSKCYQLRVT